jgi:hypothetical protein
VTRAVRWIIDPHVVEARSRPPSERDLAIAAKHNRIIAFDNLSDITPYFSDMLCRLSTGGGFGVRKNYSDDGEALFNAKRPVILNGISAGIVCRPDLQERTLFVELPTLADEARLTEEEVWGRLEGEHPRLLGALLDAAVVGLRNRSTIRLPRLPRMADAALWVEACAPALGWKQGDFVDLWLEARAEADHLALDSWSVWPELQRMLAKTGRVEGTAQGLLECLNKIKTIKQTFKGKDWPATPEALAGQLRRYTPSLGRVGVRVQFLQRRANKRPIRIEVLKPAEVA